MDHGGEAARPTTTVGSTDLGLAGVLVQGGDANIGSGAFDGQLSASAPRRAGNDGGFQPSAAAYHNSTVLPRHVRSVPAAVFRREPGVANPNIGEFRRQVGLVDVALLSPHLPDGVVHVLDNNYGYSAVQPRAGLGAVLDDLLPGGVGAVYNGDYYALQPRPGAGRDEVFIGPLPGGAGHGEVLVGLLPGGVDVVYDDYGYYALQPRPVAGHGEVLVDLLPNGAEHDEVFVDLLPGSGGAMHDNYGYYYDAWQPRPGTGGDEVLIGPLHDGVSAVFVNSGNFAQQTPPGTGRADAIAGALHLGAGHDGSGALAGAVYNNFGTVAEHVRRLLPLAGIGGCSVAVNGLAAGPGSPAVAFDLLAMFLGGLFLVILHVLRV